MGQNYQLESQTQDFVNKLAANNAPPIYQLTPQEARNVLEQLQAGSSEKLPVITQDVFLPCGPTDKVSVKIFRPENASEPLPFAMYYHGGGWILGSAHTHERLVKELVLKANIAIAFVNYSPSPEAQFPVAIEECYAATLYMNEHAKDFQLDSTKLAVIGDSVGGNLAIGVTLLAKERKGPKIDLQILFYPVTSHELNTESYQIYSQGPWLTKNAMEWFWNAYQPDAEERNNLLASPLSASTEQLQGLPKALIITAENDVLRDEGEAYAKKLMQAHIDVTAIRSLGAIHDFVMLNALSNTPATISAIELAALFLKQTLNYK